MSVSLSYGKLINFQVPESRLEHIINLNESGATQLNFLERILDFFRTDKKGDALKELYQLATSQSNENKLEIFNRLKSFAEPAYQDRFYRQVNDNEIVFFIGEYSVATCDHLHEMMKLNENMRMLPMTRQENDLFHPMLDFILEREQKLGEQKPEELRAALIEQFGKQILELYRPDEHADADSVSLLNNDVINEEERNAVMCLKTDTFEYGSQFSRIGYKKDESGVKFNMVHPSITYLLEDYSLRDLGFEEFKAIKTAFFSALNLDYVRYTNNKSDIDNVLAKLYHAHGETLNISMDGVSANRLFVSQPPKDIGLYHGGFESQPHISDFIIR